MEAKLDAIGPNYVVNPTPLLLQLQEGETIAASSLRMTTERSKKGHFFRVPLPDTQLNAIKAKIKIDVNDFDRSKLASVFHKAGSILTKKDRLIQSEMNEMETRYSHIAHSISITSLLKCDRILENPPVSRHSPFYQHCLVIIYSKAHTRLIR